MSTKKTSRAHTRASGQPVDPNFRFERAAVCKLATERPEAAPDEATISIPATRADLAFDASYEISSLASTLRQLLEKESLEAVGKVCSGMLVRIEQLGEALSACVSTDPEGDYGLNDAALRVRIHGANPTVEQAQHAVEPAANSASVKAEVAKTPRPASASLEDGASLKRLKAAVSDMDAMSQSAFSEITTVAKMALAFMERPEAYRHTDQLANAFKMIWGKCEYAEDYINSEAERVGCNYVDDDERARWEALRRSRSH